MKDIESSFNKKTIELERSYNLLENQLKKVLAEQETTGQIHA